jgi:hypothetical protein
MVQRDYVLQDGTSWSSASDRGGLRPICHQVVHEQAVVRLESEAFLVNQEKERSMFQPATVTMQRLPASTSLLTA